MTPEFIAGLILIIIVAIIILITCFALGEIWHKGKSNSSSFSRAFVTMNGNKLVPWHFWFFVVQFVLILIGLILITQ